MTQKQYESVTSLLREAVTWLRATCDPDRPLHASELHYLIEESYRLDPLDDRGIEMLLLDDDRETEPPPTATTTPPEVVRRRGRQL